MRCLPIFLILWLAAGMLHGLPAEEPVFSPNPLRPVSFPLAIAIDHPAPEAIIRYTLDGSTPEEYSDLYAGPITLTATTIVRARAYQEGYEPSAIAEAIYYGENFFTPSPEEVSSLPVTIAFIAPPTGTVYRYTLDGSLPDDSSAVYMGPITLNEPTWIRIRVRAATGFIGSVIEGMFYGTHPQPSFSCVHTVTYEGTKPPVVQLMVTADPAIRNYSISEILPPAVVPVTISHGGIYSAETHEIRWSPWVATPSLTLTYSMAGTSGTYPVYSETSIDGAWSYTSPSLDVELVATTITSPVINLPATVAAPEIAVNPSDWSAFPIEVSLTCSTSGAEIRYTTDGSLPSDDSTLYSAALNLTETTHLRARAFQDGMIPSVVRSRIFQVADPLPEASSETTVDLSDPERPIVQALIIPGTGVTTWTYEEELPATLSATAISEGGVYDTSRHTVKWGPFADSTARNLSFQTSGLGGAYQVRTLLSVDGIDQAASRDITVSNPSLPPAPSIVIPLAAAPASFVVSPSNWAAFPIEVTLSSATPGAEIRYTTDGSEPTLASTLYTAPLTLLETTRINARVFATGMIPSVVRTAVYQLPEPASTTVTNPSIDPTEPTVPALTITVTPDPLVRSWSYQEMVPAGLTPSAISGDGIYDPVKLTIKWGPFTDAAERTFSYQLNGVAGICRLDTLLSENGVDIQSSREVTVGSPAIPGVNIEIPQIVAPPSFSQSPSNWTAFPIEISIATATPQAVIHYTTDGSVPTESSATYDGPTQIHEPTLFRARAFKAGMLSSLVRDALYQLPESLVSGQIETTVDDAVPYTPQLQVHATPPANATSWTYEERISEGLTPSNISTGGAWNAGSRTIKWGPFADAIERDFSYTLSGHPGSYEIAGTLSINGMDTFTTHSVLVGAAPVTDTPTIVLPPAIRVAAPVILPMGGDQLPIQVQITCSDPQAVIRYTLDGSVPDVDDAIYSGTITLVNPTLLVSRTFKDGFAPSASVSAYFRSVTTGDYQVQASRVIRADNSHAPFVEITVSPNGTHTCYSVTEFLPSGVQPLDVSHGGSWNPVTGVLLWGPFVDNQVRHLQFRAGGISGSYALDGFVSCNGFDWDLAGVGNVSINAAQGYTGQIWLDVDQYWNIEDHPGITLVDADLDADPFMQDSVTVHVHSSTDGVGFDLLLSETGPSTAIFTSGSGLSLTYNSSQPASGMLSIDEGGQIMVTYQNASPVQTLTVSAQFRVSDADADGIPDAWERENFGHYLSNTVSDQDGDGQPDIQEWTTGTDPNDPASRFQVVQSQSQTQDASIGDFTIRWTSVSGKAYTLQKSYDFPNFFDVATGILATPPENTYIDTNPPETTKVFYRVKCP